MGTFFGESGKMSRKIGIDEYEEIEDIYSRVENGQQHKYWFDNEEDDYE